MDKNENNDQEAFSYENSGVYAIGDLQADHLQASEQIIARQQEMILAMNMDPIFGQKMYTHITNDGYIIKDDNGIYHGTKFFYQAYHNCIDNIWLISTAANTGQGKGDIDPIEWLLNHKRFGQRFFIDAGGLETINKSAILYTSSAGVVLAKAAREWFE